MNFGSIEAVAQEWGQMEGKERLKVDGEPLRRSRMGESG